MPADKIKINFGGKEVEAAPVNVDQTSERWNEYLLEDGTVLKMKLVLTKVLKVDSKYDKDGNPVYVMQSTNVTSVNAPNNLRRNG